MTTVKYVSHYPLKRATDGASGYDLRADLPEGTTLTILPGGRRKVPTGIYLAMPPDMEAQIRPRSGLTATDGVVAATGTIDADYRGGIAVVLFNLGGEEFKVRDGDRIAQLVFSPVIHPSFMQMSKPSDLPETLRGDAGFGSTGMRAMDGEPSDEHGHPLPTPGPLPPYHEDICADPVCKAEITQRTRDAIAGGTAWWCNGRLEEVRNGPDGQPTVFSYEMPPAVRKEMAAADAYSLRAFNSDGVYGSVSPPGEVVGLAPFIPGSDAGDDRAPPLAVEVASLIKSRCSAEGGPCHCDRIRRELNADLDARRVGLQRHDR